MNIIAYAHSLKLAKIYTISIRECVDQDERVFEQFLLRHEILREIIYAAQASLDRATFSNFRHRPGQAVSSAAVAPSQTSIFIHLLQILTTLTQQNHQESPNSRVSFCAASTSVQI